jgi:hypothetical protein
MVHAEDTSHRICTYSVCCRSVWVPICAVSFANLGMGGADLTQYLMFGVLSLPLLLLSIGLILWARSLYRRR